MKDTLKEWATGKLAMFTLGLAAGYALYRWGIVSQLAAKIFNRQAE